MDKLTIINRALTATGNDRVSLNDGTPEWVAAEEAFDRCIDDVITAHGWPFARTSIALVAAPSNPSKKYDYAHVIPPQVLVIKGVYVDGYKTEIFERLGNVLCLDHDSGIEIEFIENPPEERWHLQAAEALTQKMEVAFLRSLNEDFGEARLKERDIELVVMPKVRAMIDAENPARNVWRGGATQARERRRGTG